MAILEELGLKATIQMHGTSLVEYVDSPADPLKAITPGRGTKICERYVESTAGAEFDLTISVIPDGGQAWDWIMSSSNNELHVFHRVVGVDSGSIINHSHCTLSVTGHKDFVTNTIRKYRFAEIAVHHDDISKEQLAHDKQMVEETGQIRIWVCRAVKTANTIWLTAPTQSVDAGPINDSLSLHEKALKGTSLHHMAGLAEGVPDPHPTGHRPASTHVRIYVDPQHSPLAIFEFKYRSRKGLQDEMIIPRPREPNWDVPLDMARLSLEKLKSFARERLDHIRNCKLEKGEDIGEDLVDVGKLSRDELVRLARERLTDVEDGNAEVMGVAHDESLDKSASARAYKDKAAVVGGREFIDLTEE